MKKLITVLTIVALLFSISVNSFIMYNWFLDRKGKSDSVEIEQQGSIGLYLDWSYFDFFWQDNVLEVDLHQGVIQELVDGISEGLFDVQMVELNYYLYAVDYFILENNHWNLDLYEGDAVFCEDESPVRYYFSYVLGEFILNGVQNLSYDYLENEKSVFILRGGSGFIMGYGPDDYIELNIASVLVSSQSSLPLPPDPEKEGHHFVGWYLDEELTIAYDGRPIYEDTVLYAKFEINKYTVTFESNGGNNIVSQTVDWDTMIEQPEVARLGHDFMGWYTDQAFTQAFDFNTTIKQNYTLYARWQIKTFTVTFMIDDELYITLTVEWGTTLEQLQKLLEQLGYYVKDEIFDDIGKTEQLGPNFIFDSDYTVYGELQPSGLFAKIGRGLDIFFGTWWLWLAVSGGIVLIGGLYIAGKKRI
ncbi:MAG: InlB B-repeat-containing protein [Clostridiales bacterium]|jgi:uncharacterized repeat protein (TIGR02543 family)|nr:InlB B-repeat-containing protein [Clostridiales bacterium]